MQGGADIGNLYNYGESPINYYNYFVNQITLNYDQFFTDKVFLRVNNVVTKDDRYNPFTPANHFKFLDIASVHQINPRKSFVMTV